MKIKSLAILLFLCVSSNLSCQKMQTDLSVPLIDTIMIMWTKIDLVRAINTDIYQKNIFLIELINSSFDVYNLAAYIKKHRSKINEEFYRDIANLLIVVGSSFQEVFVTVNNTNFYIVGSVLQEAINLLKIPEDIEPNITP